MKGNSSSDARHPAVSEKMSCRSWTCSLLHLLLFVLHSSFTDLSIADDTLYPDQYLYADLTIVSKDGNFEMGFFQSTGTFQNFYLAIWYKKISYQTVIWVANRANPTSDPLFSQLKISENGNLVILNESQLPVWSSNSEPNPMNSTIAVLLDTGNLVLRDMWNSSAVLWQSFDHPTDTLMPGGWIGANKITRQYQSLVSWTSYYELAPGPFTTRLDPDGSDQLVLLWNDSETYWTSGDWVNHSFTSIPLHPLYNYSYIKDDMHQLFTFTVTNKSTVTRIVMGDHGQLSQLTWDDSKGGWIQQWSVPRAQCDVYSLCGAFGVCSENSSQYCNCLQGFVVASPVNWFDGGSNIGCTRKTPLQCSDNLSTTEERDEFLMITAMRLPNNSHLITIEGKENCESACLNKCSCTAYAYRGGCLIWFGELRNLQQVPDGGSETEFLYIRLAASQLPSSGSMKSSALRVTLLSVAGAMTMFCVVLGLAWKWQRRRSTTQITIADHIALVPFTYTCLRRFTLNFSEILGRGSFGTVFKGTLPDTTVIAVKKLQGLRQGEKQFRSEVTTLGLIQHVNLIRLRGFCTKGNERLLVYDYMPNGSLDSHLFRSDSKVLGWKTRYKIILGVAKGLEYLHERCRDCIIHSDIKPENILLDEEFCPRVADFGMAKLLGRDFSRVLTTMRGTIGYLAPEWLLGVPITPKADVYSYGMMLFEVISGRRNSEPIGDGNVCYFPIRAAMEINEGEVFSLLDERLEGDADMEELNRVCIVACWCIQDSEANRPSMGQVVQILQGLLEVSVPPVPRYLHQIAQDLTTTVSTC